MERGGEGECSAVGTHAVHSSQFMGADLLVPIPGPPQNDGVVITDRHKSFRVTGVKCYTVHHVIVREFM